MYVNYYDQLMRTGLEEQVLDVAEEHINIVSSMVFVSQTVLVNLNLTGDTLAVQSRSYEDVIETGRFPI
jgi:hypothetical protein